MLRDSDVIAFVHTSDIVRARTFYLGVLGLEFVEETPFALVVRSGGTMIRITPVPSHSPSPYTVLGWSVSDVDEVVRELNGHGVTALGFAGLDQDPQGVWQSPSGARVVWFADPDGNTLSLTQF